MEGIGTLRPEGGLKVQTSVRVGVNGYGVIGKRVADAIAVQDDMELVGVADVVSDYRIRVAAERGYPVFASVPDRADAMRQAGIRLAGSVEDLIGSVDVMVDCTPKGIGERNRSLYESAGIKAVFQGGESHALTGLSFTAQVNYAEALSRQFARVVSCNTTALCRISHPLVERGWVKRARAVLMRRATDPWETHKNGMINTAVPETKVPSHQGPDARTVLRGLDITTMAGAGPYNLSHLHFAMVETAHPVSVEELREALLAEPRIAFVRGSDGLESLSSVIELMRDLDRPRNDMWEVAVWEDALAADERELYLTFQVHNEAITIPENVDCIRALTGIEREGARSIAKTDRALGVVKEFLPATSPAARRFEGAERSTEAGLKGAEEPELVGTRR